MRLPAHAFERTHAYSPTIFVPTHTCAAVEGFWKTRQNFACFKLSHAQFSSDYALNLLFPFSFPLLTPRRSDSYTPRTSFSNITCQKTTTEGFSESEVQKCVFLLFRVLMRQQRIHTVVFGFNTWGFK
jgi:hypothetical protein